MVFLINFSHRLRFSLRRWGRGGCLITNRWGVIIGVVISFLIVMVHFVRVIVDWCGDLRERRVSILIWVIVVTGIVLIFVYISV